MRGGEQVTNQLRTDRRSGPGVGQGPVITVITVCRNAASTIEKTIQSVLWQDYADYEYVIIDGMSSDDTPAIIEKYCEHLAIVVREPDTGIYNAMNKGIRHSSGEVLMFLGADDCLASPYVLSRVARAFRDDPGLDMVYGNFIWDSGTVQRSGEHPDVLHRQYFLIRDRTIQHQSLFCQRRLFEAIGGFDESLVVGADRDWILRALFQACARYRHIPLFVVTYYAQGLSGRVVDQLTTEKALIRKRHFTRVQRMLYWADILRRRVLYRLRNRDFHPPMILQRLLDREKR